MIACSPKDLPTEFSTSAEASVLKVSHMTTKSELETISKSLLLSDIILEYDQSEFFEDGRLRTLRLKVLTPAGSGQTSADLTNLQYKYYGFIYDTNAPILLKMGYLE